jgi:low molecular weight protein-tyrosine phosphatase
LRHNSIPESEPGTDKIKVLMVCLGNICRSPTAHGVLDKIIKNKRLTESVEVDSAGTSTYHIGDPPDPRSIAAAQRRGYDLSDQIARQVHINDFYEFDYILAMDGDNLQQLLRTAPKESRAKIQLLLDYSSGNTETVPDPYFGGGEQGFETVLDLIENACTGLLEQLERDLRIAQQRREQ